MKKQVAKKLGGTALGPQRRVTEIHTSVTSNNLNIVVLCDDGTVWQYKAGDDTWSRLADIPQE